MTPLTRGIVNSWTGLSSCRAARGSTSVLFQVNPFAYLVRHSKPTTYGNESDYNRAVVTTCKEEKVEVIGVTDHYRIGESKQLIQDAAAAGIVVFPGFEAVSKGWSPLLVPFQSWNGIANIERKIGDCGVHDSNQASPGGNMMQASCWSVANNGARSALQPMSRRMEAAC